MKLGCGPTDLTCCSRFLFTFIPHITGQELRQGFPLLTLVTCNIFFFCSPSSFKNPSTFEDQTTSYTLENILLVATIYQPPRNPLSFSENRVSLLSTSIPVIILSIMQDYRTVVNVLLKISYYQREIGVFSCVVSSFMSPFSGLEMDKMNSIYR